MKMELKKETFDQELITIAKKSGAKDAKMISTEKIIIDPRVRLKCLIPPCNMSGICINCPPYGFSHEQTKRKVNKYNNAIFFHVEVESKFIAGQDVGDAFREYNMDKKGKLLVVGAYQLLVFQIAALIEKKAKELGYKPSGYVAGSCKELLCFFHDDCSILAAQKPCRHQDISRPSMESCGMDVFKMATEVGWDIYPIGRSLNLNDVPRGILLGLVLIN
jgi:predicted metal-binding protein